MSEGRLSPEAQAQLGARFEQCCPTETPASAVLIEHIVNSSRAENQAAAARLLAIGELFAYRLRRGGETEDWAVDTTAAVAAEVAAALRISHELAVSQLRYARAMREQLPTVGAVFAAGDIDLRLFQTLVYRTDLITDPDVLTTVDAQLAAVVARWPSMTRNRLAARIDRIVTRLDPDAVRQRKTAIDDREVWISDRLDGLSDIGGSVFTTTAHALDNRLSALADTVCDQDPRTKAQRRADAVEALAAGADRISCQCGQADCPAGGYTAGPVVIHGVADTAGTAAVIGGDGLLPPEVLAEIAPSATHKPVIHPGDAPPEPGYTPSTALAEFVRCRDLTCRFPGCDRPATHTDIDHTIPHAAGGPTQAANLKCLCRLHHLLKTFGDWKDLQLRDGTVIWTAPSGEVYVTTPGSMLLFPSLCAPTAPAACTEPPPDRCDDRTTMMPKRRRTRAQNRTARITAERKQNHADRLMRQRRNPYQDIGRPRAHNYDQDPPPF